MIKISVFFKSEEGEHIEIKNMMKSPELHIIK
jgi:hypothetical protein